MVGAGFDPTTAGDASQSPQGWMLSTYSGVLYHASHWSDWEGQPEVEELEEGDVVVRLPLSAPACRCHG